MLPGTWYDVPYVRVGRSAVTRYLVLLIIADMRLRVVLYDDSSIGEPRADMQQPGHACAINSSSAINRFGLRLWGYFALVNGLRLALFHLSAWFADFGAPFFFV